MELFLDYSEYILWNQWIGTTYLTGPIKNGKKKFFLVQPRHLNLEVRGFVAKSESDE